ncbi:hypothetical protein M0657_008465 [Pyricularia oryzae]|nr:hypothetical protein M0657_008465 [Pyricularia oryzae]KAI7923390.1 hypothetical protein M9X92_004382 [Pyricularia oryzae]
MNSIMYLYDWLLSQCCEILGSDEDSPCKSITRSLLCRDSDAGHVDVPYYPEADQPEAIPVSSSASGCSVDSLGREKATTADVANGTRDLTEPKTGFRAALGRVPRKPFLMIWYMIALELRHIVELLYWFGIGIFWPVQDKHFGHAEMEHPQEKAQEVGFAQLIPLILLVLPLMQLVEAYARLSDRKYDGEKERDTEHVPGG